MRSAGGGKVLSLFMLAFPHCLTRLFYLLWQPLALLLLVLLTGLLVARIFSRLHMISAFSVFPTSLLLLVSTHVLFVGVIWWSMSKACSACHTHHLPSSPFLTAHRGCSMDFPENSLAAFRPASRISSVRTLETDVQVSADGELFLLHDPHLARTTTVSTACPHIDPLHNASELNYHSGPCPLVSVLLQHGSLHVPLFSEFLKIAAAERMNVVFDLYRPVSGHNYEHRYVNMTLDALLQSGIDLSKVWVHNFGCHGDSQCFTLKVWWVRGGEDQGENPVIPARFSNLTLIGKTSQIGVDRFNALGISVANEEWTTSLDTLRWYMCACMWEHAWMLISCASFFRRKLQSQNVSVNMYTINSLLMYDYAWCAGVHSVTTDNCIMLDAHNHNYLYQVRHANCYIAWDMQLLHCVFNLNLLVPFLRCATQQLHLLGLSFPLLYCHYWVVCCCAVCHFLSEPRLINY